MMNLKFDLDLNLVKFLNDLQFYFQETDYSKFKFNICKTKLNSKILLFILLD